MEKRLSRWGVGPKITASTLGFAAAGGILSYAFPQACVVPALGHPAATTLAAILLVIGAAMWLAAILSVMRAYNRDQLVTSGIFSIVRNPIYAAWIVLILPGLALLSRSWPLLVTPLAAYAVFRRTIHVEDEYLAKRYGKAYLEYRSRVSEIVPIPRFRRT